MKMISPLFHPLKPDRPPTQSEGDLETVRISWKIFGERAGGELEGIHSDKDTFIWDTRLRYDSFSYDPMVDLIAGKDCDPETGVIFLVG